MFFACHTAAVTNCTTAQTSPALEQRIVLMLLCALLTYTPPYLHCNKPPTIQNWAPKVNAFRICNSLCTVDIVTSSSLSMVVANMKLLHRCEHHLSCVSQLPEMKGLNILSINALIKKLTSWTTILGDVDLKTWKCSHQATSWERCGVECLTIS